jgi:hypothetical protein
MVSLNFKGSFFEDITKPSLTVGELFSQGLEAQA